MPASIAAASSRESGRVMSTPDTSPTNPGWICRIAMLIAARAPPSKMWGQLTVTVRIPQNVVRRLPLERLLHARERGAVDMVGTQDHRHALVCVGDPVVFVPVRAAPARGGAIDVP